MMMRTAIVTLFVLLLPGQAQAGILDTLFTAQEWQTRGDLAAAREAVQSAVVQFPEDTFARIRLAQLNAALGNPADALSGLDTLLAQDPDNLLALLWKGHILIGPSPAGDSTKARASYQRVLTLDASNGWAMAGLALCLLAEGNDKEAIPLLEKAQTLAGEDATLHHVLGNTYAALGLAVNARMELEQTLEINPRNLSALTSLGDVYMRLGHDSLAQNAWRQALAIDASDGLARQRLIAAMNVQARQAVTGGKEEATRLWRTILGYDAGNPEALWNLRNPGETRGAAPGPRPGE